MALEMSLIHYEWSSVQTEEGETIRLWAWRRRALIIDSLPLFFTHKVPFRPERTRELKKRRERMGKKKGVESFEGKRTSGDLHPSWGEIQQFGGEQDEKDEEKKQQIMWRLRGNKRAGAFKSFI